MGSIIDFSGIENCEQAIRKTWDEFRECLAAGVFSYDEIEKAKKQKFLMVYDDLFYKHSGIDQSTIVFKDLKDKLMGRGAILKNDEIPNYDRFLPKEEYIKEDNRFSPPHVEWLYLAVGNDNDIHECAQAECRAKRGNMFGFCHFSASMAMKPATFRFLSELTLASICCSKWLPMRYLPCYSAFSVRLPKII